MANTAPSFANEITRSSKDDKGKNNTDGSDSTNKVGENCPNISRGDCNMSLKSPDRNSGDLFQDPEVQTTGGLNSKERIKNLPVVQVNLSENERKLSPPPKSRDLNLEGTSLLDSVGDLARSCNVERSSLPDTFMMSVSPTTSIFNFLSPVSSPLDRTHDDNILMEPTMSPGSPSVDSILNGQSPPHNKSSHLNNGRVKTFLDNFKTVDAFISAPYLSELPEFSGAKLARKGKAAKPMPYPLTNPRKQKGEKTVESNCLLSDQNSRSSCASTLYNDHNQNEYDSGIEHLPSCRFERQKSQTLSEKERFPNSTASNQSKNQNDIDAGISQIRRSTENFSCLNQDKTCRLRNDITNEISQAVEARKDDLDSYRKPQQTETHTPVSPLQSPSSLCSSLFTSESTNSLTDKNQPPLLRIASSSTFSSNTPPMLCRYEVSSDKNVSEVRKEASAAYVSKSREFNDKDGLSQYLCGDESAQKDDLPSLVYYNGSGQGTSGTTVVNSIISARRHSSISSVTSTTSRRSNTNQSISDQQLNTQAGTRRESFRSEPNTDFQTGQTCSEASHEKRLTSPAMSEFSLDATNITSQGYLGCTIGPAGNDVGEAAAMMMDPCSPLQIPNPTSSCLYSSSFLNERIRKEEVTVPADITAWTAEHVQIWLRWTISQYGLTEVDTSLFEGMDGATLCEITWDDMAARVGAHNAQVLYGYLAFLKKGCATSRLSQQTSSSSGCLQHATERAVTTVQPYPVQSALTTNFDTSGLASFTGSAYSPSIAGMAKSAFDTSLHGAGWRSSQ
ncbi:friend leukemia integration 1 transcription factor, partial [Elysia marginata]